MRLISIRFAEFEGDAQEWTLDGLTFGPTNLIVGKNATGKSRSLNIISALSRLLAGLQSPGISAKYEVVFTDGENTLKYNLNIEQYEVIEEKLFVNGQVKLDRAKGGIGVIWAAEMNRMYKFQTPPGELAAFARRDSIQHPFLEPLHAWGASLRHFYFGSQLGKDQVVVYPDQGGRQPDDRNPNEVVGLFGQAIIEFADEFERTVIDDMSNIGYEIDKIELGQPTSFRWTGGSMPLGFVTLNVKEKNLKGITDQIHMSQGMFRALSILIQVNYSQFAKKSDCILIDDIGEGLDFDRSCCLINVLREKAIKSRMQLILSTNDRFVMNQVPLEEWSVLQRDGSHVKVRNYENSREIFEEFKFTGLSNFSFLEMDFINEATNEEIAPK